jgi:hypothetical protein
MNEEIKNRLVSFEIELHKDSVRTDAKKLDELLDDEFFEIGTSGNTYAKKDIVERLPSESSYEIKSFDFDVREIAKNVIQIFYKAEADGRKSSRSSIWIKKDSNWKMVFHQGTKIN